MRKLCTMNNASLFGVSILALFVVYLALLVTQAEVEGEATPEPPHGRVDSRPASDPDARDPQGRDAAQAAAARGHGELEAFIASQLAKRRAALSPA